MSINRDINQDRAATRAVLAGGQPVAHGPRNWLWHDADSGAAKIDEMLLNGATRNEMASARGAVDEHLRHLRTAHGLPIAEHGGVFEFDRQALGVCGTASWRRVLGADGKR